MVFNGYGYFDITELTWGIGEGGQQQDLNGPSGVSRGPASAPKRQPFYGLTVVSCERGDIRQSPDGMYVYTNDGRSEVPVEFRGPGRPEIDELCDAVQQDRPVFPDEHWGLASLELVLGILRSSEERREVPLGRQVRCPI
jgi:phthalate 4,5-cis-dihydrodiol dehydrogenase